MQNDDQNPTKLESSNNSANQNTSKGSNEDESNDGMDIDMADIVVIDEYDSTKTDTKHDESSKKVTKFISDDTKASF